ncbi:MAG: T9SS C-terminal target domain-containing protein [Saonia sp.]
MKNGALFYCFSLITYLSFTQENIQEVGRLPNTVLETSGIEFYKGKLITHNDSGNTPELFEIDTTSLEVTRTVRISNSTNVDWEDMTQDTDYFYIGDFGNFNGDRQDLVIYRISKSDYDISDTVIADRIEFFYADQTDFSMGSRSDWDAEALFVQGDRLIILTKQWQSQATVAYALPKTLGNHEAVTIGSYPVDGLVTGASYNETTKILFLIGYSQQLFPFLVRFDQLSENAIFENTGERTNMNIGIAQVEGITYVGADNYFFSSENFTNENPPINSEARLFSFMTNDSIIEEEEEEMEEKEEEEMVEGNGLILYRSFGSRNLHYDLHNQEGNMIFGRAIFDTTGRRITYTNGADIEGNTIDLSAMETAIYYLTFYLRDGIISEPFVLD